VTCPDCGGDRVAFAVPPALREYAPGESAATLCRGCLRVAAAEPTRSLPASVDWEPLPAGEAGVATALLVGLLDSLALRRADVTALVDHAERAGGDPLLALDRLDALAETGAVDPAVDVGRRARQLRSLLD
jgi:hypothetical protein